MTRRSLLSLFAALVVSIVHVTRVVGALAAGRRRGARVVLGAALVAALTACAGVQRGESATLLRDGPYTLRVDLALAGELADERGRGEIRAELTGELTFDAAGTGAQVHSRVLAVRDVYIEPRLQRRDEAPDLRALRAVLLATDAYWPLDIRPCDAPAPAAIDRRSALTFFYGLFTRDLAPPTWLPARLPALGSSSRTLRRGLHGGVEADIEETLTLAAVERLGAVQVAEFVHTTVVRGVPTVIDGRRVAVEVHERGVLRVDITRGLPVRHTRERTELRVEDGARVVRNTVALAASYTTVAGGDQGAVRGV